MATQSPALDQGTIDKMTGLITFVALPYPLPEAWAKEFREAGSLAMEARKSEDKLRMDEAELLMRATEIRARATIGVEHTRRFIRSIAPR